MKIENTIDIITINGKDIDGADEKKFYVRNVWLKSHCVEIQISDGVKVVILASDLIKAINNAINNG